MKGLSGGLLVTLLLISVSSSSAAPPRDCGPAEICLPASLGTVVFPHAVHQERIGDCRTCHHQGVEAGACRSCHDVDPAPPKAKDAFHQMCRECHQKSGGPVACAGCHTRPETEKPR